MTSLDKAYDPNLIETACYENWEAMGYFAPSFKGDAYCLMLPPPNITGSLHLGHGFGSTLMDIMVRYQRMCGKNTLWQPGTDHAGIATQMVVERQLNRDKQTRHDLGRSAFVDKIWEWKKESGGNILNQLKRMGASLDWTRERFTLDESLSHAVREVFIRLYTEGLIYRGKRLVNWDPVLLTAISDLEVINVEEPGSLWHIRYPLQNQSGHLIVATTRPETLFGDVAVAVHPDDERYQHLIGQSVKLPLTDRTIPIIADTYVDPAFGTGCVKITPAHDFNDYAVGTRHNLTPLNIFTPTAHLNDAVPTAYQGLDRIVARKKAVKALDEMGLLEKTEKYTVKVPRGDRSNAIIEPYLTAQWYVKSKPLAAPAIAAVRNGEVRFIPETYEKTYFQWLENIEDWCVSRQLWWGHRIPAWYDENGKSYVGHDEADVRKRNQLSNDLVLTQDEDVLDTWFSSALWPFATLGWPEQTKDLATFFPTQLLVTGFDIIFFWVARMMMMSLKFTGQIPFKDVYITGLIRDADGQKMSKTKGNVLDPIDLIDGINIDDLVNKRTYGLMQPEMAAKIEKNTRKEYPAGIASHGTDALRFTFCSLASNTREVRFELRKLESDKHFCNKLWNASRYVFMNVQDKDLQASDADIALFLPNLWIRSRLQKTIAQAHRALEQYRFDYFAQALYEFTWNEFCDWYLELSKVALMDENSSQALLRGVHHTLIHVLETLLRLLHPVIPFITETLWQQIKLITELKADTIMLAPYPQVVEELIDDNSENIISFLQEVITTIRASRSENQISPSKKIALLFRHGTKEQQDQIKQNVSLVSQLAKIVDINWLGDTENPPPAIASFVKELEIFIPLAGTINFAEEKTRLQNELAKLNIEREKIATKLANAGFFNKAPAQVIEKEKARQNEIRILEEKIKNQIKLMENKPEASN